MKTIIVSFVEAFIFLLQRQSKFILNVLVAFWFLEQFMHKRIKAALKPL